jgi:hypothetical protein
MNSRADRATRVYGVRWDKIARGREGLGISLGVELGSLLPRSCVLRAETLLVKAVVICRLHRRSARITLDGGWTRERGRKS